MIEYEEITYELLSSLIRRRWLVLFGASLPAQEALDKFLAQIKATYYS